MNKSKKIIIGLLLISILCSSGIIYAQTVTETDLWQQIQYYANPNTEDKAALKNCYAQLSTLYPNSPILDQALYFYSGYWERKGLYNDTVKLCKRIINTYPKSTYVYPAYLDILRIYQQNENIPGLTKSYSEFQAFTNKYIPTLASAEDKAAVYLKVGYYAQVLKQHKIAQSAFSQANQLAPKSESGKIAGYYLGLSELNERTYSGCSAAITQLNQLITQYPSDSVAMNSKFFIALAQHRIGNKDAALAGFKSFIEDNPDSVYTPKALYLSAMSYMYNKRDCTNAMKYFDQTIDWLTTRNPQGDDPKLVAGIEDTLVMSGCLYQSCEHKLYLYLNFYNYDSALTWGEQLRKNFPSDRGVHQLGKLVPIVVLVWQNKWQDVITASDNLLAQYSQDTKHWITVPGAALKRKGYALEQLGRDTEAATVYKEVVAKYRYSCSDADALLSLGKHYERNKDYSAAIAAYEQYLIVCLDTSIMHEGYLGKAKALAKLDKYPEAVSVLSGFLAGYRERVEVPQYVIQDIEALKEEYQIQIQEKELAQKNKHK
jgi:tetratricopeptide (TPR) repeat protein